MNKASSLFILILYLLAHCTEKSGTVEEPEETNTDQIGLSAAQRANAGIEVGRPEIRKLQTTISASGVLDVPPQNLIDVSAPYGGFVKNTTMLQGMRVKKGDVLAELQHPDYIQLQQDYLTSESQLSYLEAEYNRQQELANENVNAQKTLQQARSQFESMQATVQGLKAKLALLHLSPETVKAHGIQSVIRFYSPINGFVSDVHINLGKYVSPSDVMLTLVNTEHIHAELQIFERDITRIKVGQRVTFHLANESAAREAEVYLIGREIGENRAVRVHCHLEKEDDDLLPGMFISAIVETADVAVTVLPAEAVVHHAGRTFVFTPAEEENHFLLTPVTTGLQQEGFIEISFDEGQGAERDVVVKGAYTLLSLLFNTEEDE